MAYNGGKHPSFLSKTVPYQQLLAKLTPFNNGTTYTGNVNAVVPKQNTDDVYEIDANRMEFIEPIDHGMTGQKKKEVPVATNRASTMGMLLARPGPEIDEEEIDSDIRQAELDAAAKRRANSSLIGGQSGGADVWKTTQQLQNEGEVGRVKSAAGTKRTNIAQQSAIVQQVSPITGEPTADYGTWRLDAANKIAYEKAATTAKKVDTKTGLFVSSGIPLLDKVRVKLASRGANGLLGLSRIFRIMDDDGTKSLNMNEFKKAMRDMALMLTETEVKQLFQLFDRDGGGEISYDEFISVLRGPMNERRKELVQMAFEIIDRDGSGSLDINDILDVYDVSKHPDYLAKKKTKEKILSEFLDNLTCGVKGTGIVSGEAFEDYYSNISASIDSDEYFELMMRNAWHISGGVGAAANSANRRVLVTNADGTQSVQEIRNDLGLRAGDKAGMIARLQAQGLQNAASLSLFGAAGDSNLPSVAGRGLPPRGAPAKPAALASGRGKSVAPVYAPAPAGSLPQPLTRFAPVSTSEEEGEISHPLLEALRDKLVAKGSKGLIGLQRVFRIMDDDGSQSLDLNEFKKAMKEMKIVFKRESDSEVLFRLFDRDRSGTISYEEFLTAVRGVLNPRRKALVGLAFAVLDKDESGIVEPSDLIGSYDTSKHPDVLSRRKSADQVLREFLDSFDVGGVVDGRVTFEEFENYYSNISASIDDDDYFELMIRNAWHISGGVGAAANSANRRVLATRANGSQGVEEVKRDLGLRGDERAGVLMRLQAQGPGRGGEVTGVSLYDGVDNRTGGSGGGRGGGSGSGAASIVARLRSKADANRNRSPERQAALHPPSAADQPPARTVIVQSALDVALAGPSAPNPPSSSSVKTFAPDKVNAGLSYYIDQLKKELKRRGPAGYCEMQAMFESMDMDGSKSLCFNEVKTAFANLKIPLKVPDLRALFTYFDKDESGSIDFNEFMDGIRVPLNARRLAVVNLAFTELDALCGELLDFEDIAMRYNASAHPEVMARRLTAKQALATFLDTFTAGVEVEGKVTRGEFTNYYINIGASIDSDEYFDLLVRNVWGVDVTLLRQTGAASTVPVKSAMRIMLTDPVPPAQRAPQRPLSAAATKVQKRWSPVPGANVYQPEEPNAHAQQAAPPRPQSAARPPLRPHSAAPAVPKRGPVTHAHTKELSTPPAGLAFMLDHLRSALKARGAAGYTALQRVFTTNDTNGDHTLSLSELKNALKSLSLFSTDTEVRILFEYFDTDHSDSISFDEFLAVVRPPLSDQRLSLVRRVFSHLDEGGAEAVDIPLLAGRYQAAQHPEVLAGRLTARQALGLFLDTFDAGGSCRMR